MVIRNRRRKISDTQRTDETPSGGLALHRATVSSLARLARSTAHAINNFLSVSRGNIELLRERLDDAESLELAGEALSGLISAERLAGSFCALSAPAEFTARPVNPVAFMQQQLETLGTLSGKLQLEAQIANDGGYILTDPHYLEMALNALLLNASEAMEHMPVRRVRCAVIYDNESPQSVAFVVTDSGPGIPDKLKNRVFNGAYTSKANTHSGLGLWFVREFAMASGGTASLADGDGDLNGASFAIRLPVVAVKPVRPQ